MIIQDAEFGKITIRRSARSSQIRVRVAPDGTLRASLPLYAPVFLLKRLLKSSRDELRAILQQAQPNEVYAHGQQVGKSHSLRVMAGNKFKVSRHGQHIVITLPETMQMQDRVVVREVRDAVIAALRIEAKSYLPKRLSYLASKLGLSYNKVRFSHASGRWGSCSTTGTISLNIALMKLPFELIDYVIVHELSHPVHMNHSKEFWQLVASGDPDYKQHRASLKLENPSI